jgi:acetylornithine deacetylase/succinyl-diaminopimelate desuccinylase-like protein
MTLNPLETLARLVATASVNPMGRPGAGDAFYETRLTDCLEQKFHAIGLRTTRQQVAPGRANLIARLDGDLPPERGGPLLLFDAHQDTVPVDHMTIEPWQPVVRQGRLYGRGACDTKGGMAAMLAALARLAAERPRGMPSVVMTCTVDEEYAFAGATALVSSWTSASGGLIPRAPDAAVVAEPTGLDVIVAHKGVIRWRCHTSGRAAHSAQPDAGQSAIYRMARLVIALERYQRDVVAGLAAHPLCGPCTLNVGTIHGGASINIVPDRCSIEIEARFPPGVDAQFLRSRLIEGLASAVGGDPAPTHDPPYMLAAALPDTENAHLAERLSLAVTDVAGNCRRRCVPYATDAAFVSSAGTPAVVFGPGSVQQAHTDDEWVALEEVEQAAEILYRFVKDWA